MRRFFAMLVVLSLASFALAEPELKGTPAELSKYLDEQKGAVGLIGHGEVKAPGDRAVVRLRVSTSAGSLGNAIDSNRQIHADLEGKLKSRGIDPANIKTSRFDWLPQRGWIGKKASSYDVSNVVSVTVTTDQQFRDTVAVLDDYKEVQFDGATIESSKEDELKLAAIAKACEDVNQRKAAYETGLHLKLVAKAFGEEHGQSFEPVNRKRTSEGEYDSLSKSSIPAGPAAMVGELGGELTYSVKVVVAYEVQR